MTKPITVYCIPFAGGGKHSFRGYQDKAPASLNLEMVELPGRGMRITEPLVGTMEEMADDLVAQLRPRIKAETQPYAIYGHSIGSVLTYMVTCRLIREGLPLPIHLFVTGAKGPSEARKERKLSGLSDAEFTVELVKLGGVPQEVADNEELMQFFLPILRADFRAIEEYTYEQLTPKMDIPVLSITGSEENITPAQAGTWQDVTTGTFTHRVMTGDHFFIYQHEKEILNLIDQYLQEVVADQLASRT